MTHISEFRSSFNFLPTPIEAGRAKSHTLERNESIPVVVSLLAYSHSACRLNGQTLLEFGNGGIFTPSISVDNRVSVRAVVALPLIP